MKMKTLNGSLMLYRRIFLVVMSVSQVRVVLLRLGGRVTAVSDIDRHLGSKQQLARRLQYMHY